jgi:hypothetical protein
MNSNRSRRGLVTYSGHARLGARYRRRLALSAGGKLLICWGGANLEQLGILSWLNRIKRVREWVPGLFGKASAWRWAVQRTSNAYDFNDSSSKFKFQTGPLLRR